MDSICSVVVFYNPDASVIGNIHALLQQSDYIVIVDNSSSPETIDKIKEEFLYEEKVKFIFNTENLGIAAALNTGVEYAKSAGYSWVATFDQDSSIPNGFMTEMLNSYYLFPNNSLVRIISPLYRDITTGKTISAGENKVYDKDRHVLPFRVIDTTITSGNLVKIELFSEIGLFDEKLFIDMVDHDFCLRCVNNGFQILETANAILNHNLGSPNQFTIFNRSISSTNHSSIRRYYMMRNRIYLYRKYKGYPKWIINDMKIFFGRDIPKIILLEKNKLSKINMLLRGLLDGFKGKMGRIDA